MTQELAIRLGARGRGLERTEVANSQSVVHLPPCAASVYQLCDARRSLCSFVRLIRVCVREKGRSPLPQRFETKTKKKGN